MSSESTLRNVPRSNVAAASSLPLLSEVVAVRNAVSEFPQQEFQDQHLHHEEHQHEESLESHYQEEAFGPHQRNESFVPLQEEGYHNEHNYQKVFFERQQQQTSTTASAPPIQRQ
jgi:hypothetical protein